ncbi:MAG: hypothetical protein ACM37W_06630 [Actinomycetota bacterium]
MAEPIAFFPELQTKADSLLPVTLLNSGDFLCAKLGIMPQKKF